RVPSGAALPASPRHRSGRARRADPARPPAAEEDPMTDDHPAAPDAALARAAEVVGSARQVALACHVNPDGDALGSMLGLFHVLRAAGVDVIASFPTPFVT